MKYENTKHKLRKVYTDAQNNNNELNKLITENSTSKNLFKTASIPKYNFSKFKTFSSEWTDADYLEIECATSYTEKFSQNTFPLIFIPKTKYIMYKEWRFQIENIPEKFIPFITHQIAVQTNDEIAWISNFYTSFFIQEISKSNIIVIAGFGGILTDEQMGCQVKLVSEIHNPQIFR